MQKLVFIVQEQFSARRTSGNVAREGSFDYRPALWLSQRYEIHPYDASIVAAAHELGAHALYSEDLSHGQQYDGLKVVNHFLALDRS